MKSNKRRSQTELSCGELAQEYFDLDGMLGLRGIEISLGKFYVIYGGVLFPGSIRGHLSVMKELKVYNLLK